MVSFAMSSLGIYAADFMRRQMLYRNAYLVLWAVQKKSTASRYAQSLFGTGDRGRGTSAFNCKSSTRNLSKRSMQLTSFRQVGSAPSGRTAPLTHCMPWHTPIRQQFRSGGRQIRGRTRVGGTPASACRIANTDVQTSWDGTDSTVADADGSIALNC
jgi:hypothetical protein